MKLYLAGNFPQLKNFKLEAAAAERVLKHHPAYRRLISFFFDEKDNESVLRLKGERRGGNKD